jgi:hypothetical protein
MPRLLSGSDGDHRGAVANEYLTVAELAARLKLKPKTVRNRMHDGTWRRGVHWFKRAGIGPRFCWSAIVRWIEAPEVLQPADPIGAAYGPDIPLPRRRTGSGSTA